MTPATVDRFRGDCTALLDSAPEPDMPLALAVSGGPDSMAMLALATAAFPGCVIAATVDHGLRAESAGEAEMVAGWCRQQEIPHRTLVVQESAPASGNLHRWARDRRYSRLADWAATAGARALATAHHTDDQAETFLMRAARGAGVGGLTAIRDVRFFRMDSAVPASVRVVRPVLNWRRHELRTLAETARLPFIDDPSNSDDRFERARIREAIADMDWLDPVKIGKSAAYAAEANAALDAMTGLRWRERILDENALVDVRIDVQSLPREIRRRLARLAIGQVRQFADIRDGGRWEAGDCNIEPLLDSLAAGKSATRAGVLASADGEIWRFRPAPPRRSH